MKIPGFSAIPRSQRLLFVLLMGLVVVAVVQVQWWIADQERHAAELQSKLQAVADGRLSLDASAIAAERAASVERARRYSLGGAFFELPPDLTVDTGADVQVHLSAGRHHARQAARVIRITERGFAVAWKVPTVETLTVLAVLLADEPTTAPEAERTTAGS